MTTLTWIDTTEEHSWQSGLRAAVLLLRAGQTVLMAATGKENEPYLAVQDLPAPIEEWFVRHGVSFAHKDEVNGTADGLSALRAPSVAVFGGAGSPYNHASALAALGVVWFYVTGADIANGALQRADILLVPGGGWRHGSGQLADLGEAGTQATRQFVDEGGGYLSSCAGSLISMRLPDEAIGYYPSTKAEFTLLEIQNWEPLREAEGCHRSPGIGRVVARVPSPRHPVALGLPETIEISHYNGPIFAEPPENISVALQFAGVTANFTPSESFFGNPERPTDAELQASLMAEAGREGRPAVVAGTLGRGRVVLAGLHPEFGLDLNLDQWGRPVQLIGNAVLWEAQFGRGTELVVSGQEDIHQAEAAVSEALTRLREATEQLQDVDRSVESAWQTKSALRASFGRTPREVWRHAVEGLLPLVDRIRSSWEAARRAAEGPQEGRLAYAALQVYNPPEGPDLGAQGAVWLIEEATSLVDEARRLLQEGGSGQERAEELVSRSYLSAIGVLTNAAQRLETETETFAAENDLMELREMLTKSDVFATAD